MAMESTLKIKPWGNGLGVRITAQVARAAGLSADTEVRLTVEEGRLMIEPTAGRRLTLDEKLKAYDPKKHGGEFIVAGRVGVETW
jgi:antitoxin MazE